MSSCFFSSLEKIRICATSEQIYCLSTVLPKDPVPPVIKRVAPAISNCLSPLHFPVVLTAVSFLHQYPGRIFKKHLPDFLLLKETGKTFYPPASDGKSGGHIMHIRSRKTNISGCFLDSRRLSHRYPRANGSIPPSKHLDRWRLSMR